MPSWPASRKLWKPPEGRVPGGDPHRSPACTAELRLGARALGLNWGSSGPYRAANPTYQNFSSAPKMRMSSRFARGLARMAARQVTALPVAIGGVSMPAGMVRPGEPPRPEGGGSRLALPPRLPAP